MTLFFLQIISTYSRLLTNLPVGDEFKRFARALLNEHVYQWIGWVPKPNEPYLNTLLRSIIIGRLVHLRDPAVLEKCRQMFQDYLNNQTPIPADLRVFVYRSVAYDMDEKVYEQLLSVSTSGSIVFFS